MMSLNKVAIVLVNYRQPALTIECVKSLRNMLNHSWTAVIVDNDSQDDSCKLIAEACPDCVLLPSHINGGFSAGCNIGIKYALDHGAEYVLLLNNDTVVDPEMLDKLIEQSDLSTVTVPKMYYFACPDMIWYAGGYIDYRKGTAFHYGEKEIDKGQYDELREIDFATGCCILLPRNVIEKIGLMDENYFLYFEDMDYSLEITHSKFRILYCPEAKLWHKVSASTGQNSVLMEYYTNRNRFYILKKFKFPVLAKVYTGLTRCIKYSHGVLFRNNERIILKSFQDFRNNQMGKQSFHFSQNTKT